MGHGTRLAIALGMHVKRSSRRVVLLRIGTLVLLVFASLGADTLSEEDFICENVAAKLTNCCDDFDPSLMNCSYNGCGEPEVSIHECIKAMSCDEIRDGDICNRVIAKTGDPNSTDRLCL